jgi:hypothetical protein
MDCKDCYDAEKQGDRYVPSGSERCRTCLKVKRPKPSRAKKEPKKVDELEQKLENMRRSIIRERIGWD